MVSATKCSARAIKVLESVEREWESSISLHDSVGEGAGNDTPMTASDTVTAEMLMPEPFSLGLSDDAFDWFQLPLNDNLFDDTFLDSLWNVDSLPPGWDLDNDINIATEF